jgi:RNA polymerase sigma-70 factor, ECF subfamily
MNPPPSESSARMAEAYRLYSTAIMRHCRIQGLNTATAEEVMQDAFLRTWEYIQSGNEVDNLKTFLFRVANNLMIDEMRRRNRRKEVSLDELQEKGFDPGQEDTEKVREKIDAEHVLNSMDRKKEFELLTMRYVEGLRPADIATMTGLPANTVAVRLHRALKRLGGKFVKMQ